MIVDKLILSQLLSNEQYLRQVITHLKSDYFNDDANKVLFDEINQFFTKYNAPPSKESLIIQLDSRRDVNELTYDSVTELLSEISECVDIPKYDWLIDETEKFCRDKAIYNAIREAVIIINNEHKTLSKHAIPDLLQKALSISFDSHIGHDFVDDAENRYDYYTNVEEKLSFGIDWLDTVTHGGLPRKTLSGILSPSNAGKTTHLISIAANHYKQGNAVLYITMEMAEQEIMKRFDANLLDVNVNDFDKISKREYLSKIDAVKKLTVGKFLVKEYPTGSAHSGHFRFLLNELKTKHNFIPDVIYIDYLGICASARVTGNANQYTVLKNVAEEIRGLAIEFNCRILTAMQTNRGGYGASDLSMQDTADSMGVVHVLDLYWALIRTEELDELGQCMYSILKNRLGKNTGSCIVGIDYDKMRVINLNTPKYQAREEPPEINEVPPWVSSSKFDKFSNIVV